MRVCYFGIFDPAYSRNKNIIKGLRRQGVGVIEIIDTTPGPRKYWQLLKKFWPIRKQFDVMVVGFPGQIIVPFAKLITRKPVVFDLHVSYYDSIIKERRQYPARSFAAVKFYLMDFIACRLADRVLLDTKVHVSYVAKLLRMKESKFDVIYHGIDDELFTALRARQPKSPDAPFVISFHGYIQLLNGMEFVLQAMEMLRKKNIKLWIIGGGPEYKKMQRLTEEMKLESVEFYPPMPPTELVPKIRQADLGLGFFSESEKIDRVIANKVYELMALRVPVLTGESRAMGEQFTDGEHVFFCKKGSATAIADEIVSIMADEKHRIAVADAAYERVSSRLTPTHVGAQVMVVLNRLIALK